MGGVAKRKKTKLDVENIFAGPHTEDHWRCGITSSAHCVILQTKIG
jgi:hypothetical protein